MNADGAGFANQTNANPSEDTPRTTENQGEPSPQREDVAGTGLAILASELHAEKLKAELVERELKVIMAVEKRLRKPYYRRWVQEANSFFSLSVHLRHRTNRMRKRLTG
jgi:hypothetical protein